MTVPDLEFSCVLGSITPIYTLTYSKARKSSIDPPIILVRSGVVYSSLPFIVSELKAFASIFRLTS